MNIKSYFFTIVALMSLLFIVGCEREDAVVAENGTEVSITAVLSPDAYGVKSQDVPGDGTLINRCIMQIFRIENGEPVAYGEKLTVSVSGSSVSFDNVSFLPGYDYQLVFWADYTDDPEGMEDCHYNTSSLPEIVISERSAFGLNDDSYDAFSCVYEISDGNIPEAVEAVLTRPFGQLNIYASDVDNASAEPASVSISFGTGFPIGKNLITDEVLTDELAMVAEGTAPVLLTESAEHGTQMCYAYIWAPSVAQFTLPQLGMSFFDADQNEVGSYTDANSVPVRANYRTNITGSFFTSGVSGTSALHINMNTNNNF